MLVSEYLYLPSSHSMLVAHGRTWLDRLVNQGHAFVDFVSMWVSEAGSE